MIDNAADPLGRISRPDLVNELLDWVTHECDLGTISAYSVSEFGYDDCNIAVRTTSGSYLVKVLTTARPAALSRRYAAVLERVIAAGVAHPRLHTVGGRMLLHHEPSGNLVLVMDFVAGATFLHLGTHPDATELDLLVDQVRRIHAIDMVPAYQHDWWAVPHIAGLLAQIGPLLPAGERRAAQAAADRFASVDLAALPHALVHGDLTKTNVMRAAAGGIVILDFAVANRYPRVHELAMIAVNLMHGDPMPMPERLAALADRYAAGGAGLTPAERAALPPYAFAAAAMELLGATREWELKGNRSAETRYLLDLGRHAVETAAC